MSILQGKKILLGVTGSIAAYKSAPLVRLLVKEGAEVQPLMTEASKSFIGPTTLATLAKRPALSQYTANDTGTWNNHVELGLWGDMMLIAPVSAQSLAKLSYGFCDNLLTAVYLSARCPVFLAPAMDLDMFAHPATQRNLYQLQQDGCTIIEPESGELASGLSGKGRMAEPENIVAFLKEYFSSLESPKPLAGKKVLITAGPTHEHIDPVRYITNASSGKMGYALAVSLKNKGADVTVVTGPVSIPRPAGISFIKTESASDMYEAVLERYAEVDITVFAAAVADYTPKSPAGQKIKKNTPEMGLEMIKTKDIAVEMGKRKQAHQVNIGFALETNDELANAKKKLEKKNFDLVVLNSLQDAGAGFGHPTNRVTLIDPTSQVSHELKTKEEVAEDITEAIIPIVQSKK
jgi:phosphopantothenoylcysteine decarboxylase/phosphopantothenate--cysteine ligase